MLVTSAVKPISQTQADARAINFLVKRLGTRKGYSQVAATDPGTPIVYYSPALTELAMSLTVDVGFNDVPGEDIRNFGTLLQKAGAIPAFIAHSAFLIGAGLVTKLVAKIAELAETQPVLSDTDMINFVTPGQQTSLAGFKILAPEDFPDDFLHDNQVNDLGQLTDATGHAYDGDLPYVTLSLDGTDRPDLKTFEATQASAAMLADYFAVSDGYPQELQLALDSLQLYSDLQFRYKADKLKDQMEKLGSGDEFDELKVMYDAYIKNINEEVLRPSG